MKAKHIDEYYKDWCGEHHTTNSCHPVHDSAEVTDFAKFYHSQMMSEFETKSKPCIRLGARYKCLLCGRDKFTRKSPHNCVGGYRKHKIQWQEIIENQ